jgi:glycosyltransferase involved in cell wall biosynthesis
MKKVGILSSFPPNRDGIAPATRYHAEGLKNTDWQPVVLADSKRADIEIDRRSPFIWRSVRDAIAKEGLDLLHFHHTLTLYRLGGLFLPPIGNRVPVVGSFHELRHTWPEKPYYARQAVAHQVENALVKWTDASIVHTEKDERKLSQRFPSKRIEGIPLGNPVREAEPPEKVENLLIFGFIHSNKDIKTVIESMDLQKNRKLVVAGNPSDDHGDEGGQIKRIEKHAEERENVELRLRWIPEEDKDKLFQWADTVVIPYLYGTSEATREAGDSGTLREAMSYNTPVVTSTTQVFEETMENFQVGKTTALTPQAVAASIDEIEADLTKVLDELERYREENSWNKVANRYAELYDELER